MENKTLLHLYGRYSSAVIVCSPAVNGRAIDAVSWKDAVIVKKMMREASNKLEGNRRENAYPSHNQGQTPPVECTPSGPFLPVIGHFQPDREKKL